MPRLLQPTHADLALIRDEMVAERSKVHGQVSVSRGPTSDSPLAARGSQIRNTPSAPPATTAPPLAAAIPAATQSSALPVAIVSTITPRATSHFRRLWSHELDTTWPSPAHASPDTACVWPSRRMEHSDVTGHPMLDSAPSAPRALLGGSVGSASRSSCCHGHTRTTVSQPAVTHCGPCAATASTASVCPSNLHTTLRCM
jgi:hypothetical protein